MIPLATSRRISGVSLRVPMGILYVVLRMQCLVGICAMSGKYGLMWTMKLGKQTLSSPKRLVACHPLRNRLLKK